MDNTPYSLHYHYNHLEELFKLKTDFHMALGVGGRYIWSFIPTAIKLSLHRIQS